MDYSQPVAPVSDDSPMYAEFNDPRLVAIYDTVNPYRPETQPRFYRELAAELGATTIVDLGCGTGLITCELARRGHRMIGVEPSAAMIAIARARPCGDDTRWINGDASAVGTPDADLAIMTGHVAQFFITDDAWRATLGALHAALRAGGRLAFESRNPAARGWERWTRDRQVVNHPTAGVIETWTEVQDVRDGIVSCTGHYAFTATGEELSSPMRLRFRTQVELTQSLAHAGFRVERMYGDWDRHPVAPTRPELIVVAAR